MMKQLWLPRATLPLMVGLLCGAAQANTAALTAAAGPAAALTEELTVEIPADDTSKSSALANSKLNSDKSLAGKSESEIQLAESPAAPSAAKIDSKTRMALGFSVIAITFGLSILAYRKIRFKDVKGPQFHVKVVTQHHLSPRKSLAVVQIAGETLLIGVTDHHISHLKTLSLLDEDLEVPTEKNFNAVFKPEKEETDLYSIQKIHDVVSSRIKGMRSLG